MALTLPPLSLYIHIPWCVQKCPYCDFNSHATHKNSSQTVGNTIPESTYIACLLDDLKQDLHYVQGRKIHSIFFGGGTPSLFSAKGIQQILSGVQSLVELKDNCEITLEANPGTVETEKLASFIQAGINRFSIGVQSLQAEKLQKLGRIHNANEAINAANLAQQLPINSFNLDLMHGLPDQSLQDALYDLNTALDQSPPHLSWYQLTIEPNTLFGSKPPILPEDDALWAIQEQGHQLLTTNGYQQYEISAYAKPGHQCQHNLNYWRFGDYLGIGCGAHGKITLANEKRIIRTEKVKHPTGYMDLAKDYLFESNEISQDDLAFNYFINRCRLMEAIPHDEFSAYTGLVIDDVSEFINQATSKGFIDSHNQHWQVTPLGHRYLNELLEMLI
ncbi:YggW family oxidoreductase [Saccharobesus litoralis]|uniref:Heme chaperone HemW n=1 Tax=Saccharobesus litoralis TaxID=2172099 RepID=A0A2S0VSM1_9ALTE|nr:radical SAM family heme chaperone HemW [Saccharobesus litoralis]AWB67211.1 YggW family oxidoreductase [Saccharobesus litoralis]